MPVVSALGDVLEAMAEGSRVHARVDQGARAVPGILAALDGDGIAVARRHRLAPVARRRLPPPHGARLPQPTTSGRHVEGVALTQTLFLTVRVLRQPRAAADLDRGHDRPAACSGCCSTASCSGASRSCPGFGTTSYVDYLTPGVAVMTAFFSGSWAGMGMIEDLDRGVLERFLATPAHRGAIVFGRILESAIVATLQAVLILVAGLALGATNGGPIGLARDPRGVVPRSPPGLRASRTASRSSPGRRRR